VHVPEIPNTVLCVITNGCARYNNFGNCVFDQNERRWAFQKFWIFYQWSHRNSVMVRKFWTRFICRSYRTAVHVPEILDTVLCVMTNCCARSSYYGNCILDQNERKWAFQKFWIFYQWSHRNSVVVQKIWTSFFRSYRTAVARSRNTGHGTLCHDERLCMF
jgi:hypothetical protein